MRKNTDLLIWAASWHWPALVLSEQERLMIRAGEESWQTFVARPDRKAKLLAWQRIHRWTELTDAGNDPANEEIA